MSRLPTNRSCPLATRALWLFSVSSTLFAGQAFMREAAESNVNSRYTIESVAVDGVRLQDAKLPSALRKRLNRLVGQRCDVGVLQDIASDLRNEMHLGAVTEHLMKGSRPDHIRVDFDIVRRDVAFDLSVPKFLYRSQQGWTGELDAGAQILGNSLMVGAVSNGDDLAERYSGASARLQTAPAFSGRVRFGLDLEAYRDEWNSATRAAASGPDLYRARRNIAPTATVALNREVSLAVGLSFEQMAPESSSPGARDANALTGEIRYHREVETADFQQTLDGRYSLRAALSGLGSDFSYSRHAVSARYRARHGRHQVSDELSAGFVSGRAPLFERFVLGGGANLRGWDRYSIDPLGGVRMAHNTAAYGYQTGPGTVEGFYDAGAILTTGARMPIRHSLGAGYRQGVFMLAVAFPVAAGHVSPVFMAGMNY